ncbi:hypothetical protein ABY61_23520 [Klebsiella aerogenes]|uniref:hypothetical protein n=1 Tax=Klebsiella aerogenes TaxID=548 RepID=UPI00064B6BC5|nr:hypothetical protein [Klebsiella aerogenes]AKK84100.1 hypothetical protein ABY61_23520 [Klebsiella aerogenes]
MELTVSISTVITACLGFLGVYVLMPFALIGRDILLIKFINKVLLNKDFWLNVRIMESDRAHYNYLYSKSTSINYPVGDGTTTYKIDGKEVSKEKFENYEKHREFHSERMNAIWQRIALKNNIAVKMFKYFKLDEYNNFLEKRSADLYEQAMSFIKQSENNVQTEQQVNSSKNDTPQ